MSYRRIPWIDDDTITEYFVLFLNFLEKLKVIIDNYKN